MELFKKPNFSKNELSMKWNFSKFETFRKNPKKSKITWIAPTQKVKDGKVGERCRGDAKTERDVFDASFPQTQRQQTSQGRARCGQDQTIHFLRIFKPDLNFDNFK